MCFCCRVVLHILSACLMFQNKGITDDFMITVFLLFGGLVQLELIF